MSTLTNSMKSNLNTLYSCKNEFDWLMTQKEISLKQVDRLFKLKKDMLYSLSCILSINSEELLSNSFYTNVNRVEQSILDILNEKKSKLVEMEKPHQKMLNESKKIISLLYSVDILENEIHISTQNEEKLVELKNLYIKIHELNQRQIALNHIYDLIKSYTNGFKKLLQFIDEYDKKEFLSIENKQEIFDAFSSIALVYNKSKIRNKIFSENETNIKYNDKIEDYLEFYEQVFLNLVDTCKFHLPSFYYQIKNEINEYDINDMYINAKVDFIYSKYNYDIKNELKKINRTRKIKLDKLKKNIISLIVFDGKANLDYLLKDVEDVKYFPSYVKDESEYKLLNKLVLNTDFYLNQDIKIQRIVDKVASKLIEEFNGEEYIKGYIFNRADSIRQMAHFRQYFIEALDTVKLEVAQQYIDKIKELLPKTRLKDYDLKANNERVYDVKSEIKLLEHALEYINDNYREFNSRNLKLYINSIQRRYNVEELYEEINKRKLKNSYKTKTKNLIEKEKEYLKSFINKDIIKQELKAEIIESCICEDEKLKKEILEAI